LRIDTHWRVQWFHGTVREATVICDAKYLGTIMRDANPIPG
jgi:hypothetical protein